MITGNTCPDFESVECRFITSRRLALGTLPKGFVLRLIELSRVLVVVTFCFHNADLSAYYEFG